MDTDKHRWGKNIEQEEKERTERDANFANLREFKKNIRPLEKGRWVSHGWGKGQFIMKP